MSDRQAVEKVIEQYLLFLEGKTEHPRLDTLSLDDRQRAETLIRSLQVARGMDPESSPPSIERLLASAGHPPTGYASGTNSVLGVDEIQEEMADLIEKGLTVVVDVAAQREGIRSDFVAHVAGHRLRIQVRDDLEDVGGLTSANTLSASASVFGRFPDTAGVVALFPDASFSSVVIDPFDCEYCIEAPTGRFLGPRAVRPVLPLAESVRAFLDEISPAFDPVPAALTRIDAPLLEVDDIVRNAVNAMIEEGNRARIPEKRTAWSTLGRREVEGIADLIAAASEGALDDPSLARQLQELAEIR